MKRYTLSELLRLPTLSNAQDSDLKIDRWDPKEGTGRRVWLLRDPDQPMVIVEEYDPDAVATPELGHATPPCGRWVERDRYAPEDGEEWTETYEVEVEATHPVVVESLLRSTWYAVRNDVIGGWSMTNVDKPVSQLDPRQGEVEIGDALSEEIATRIVTLHNQNL